MGNNHVPNDELTGKVANWVERNYVPDGGRLQLTRIAVELGITIDGAVAGALYKLTRGQGSPYVEHKGRTYHWKSVPAPLKSNADNQRMLELEKENLLMQQELERLRSNVTSSSEIPDVFNPNFVFVETWTVGTKTFHKWKDIKTGAVWNLFRDEDNMRSHPKSWYDD